MEREAQKDELANSILESFLASFFEKEILSDLKDEVKEKKDSGSKAEEVIRLQVP